MLNISKKSAPYFVNFSRLQQISNIQAEIYQKNLEIELLKLEKDTADVVHPFFLAQKCHTLQSMNNHLEAVLKEKRSLRQRLLKTTCEENLPIEAVYHRYMVHLLELAVTFIERLENHLETIRNIPHLDENLRKMSHTERERERGRDTGRGRSRLHAPGARRGIQSRVFRIAPWAKGKRQTAAPPRDPQSMALAKMDMLVTETEELAENILKWREQQKEISSCIPKILAEENYLHKHDVIMPSLPFTSKVHVQTINSK
ncbi:HAUS augmin-like complex subunit 2 isoform X3 [Canis lupus dingo]|nr:HAUS augmin-like complex subunit 2 isoform X3 [Canis lupus dingo]XP_048960036.1 HAUS augmin-like complex subunit 2 isoform X3 [Canis lupus dingo]